MRHVLNAACVRSCVECGATVYDGVYTDNKGLKYLNRLPKPAARPIIAHEEGEGCTKPCTIRLARKVEQTTIKQWYGDGVQHDARGSCGMDVRWRHAAWASFRVICAQIPHLSATLVVEDKTLAAEGQEGT